ncbi:MAG: dihydrolipoyllysine-residue succinyltransferase [Verrucomicrobia bacterium]|nr:dihydrolipoyllysine-residue succinyltransferase [Verrucomicrobiota bacterium]
MKVEIKIPSLGESVVEATVAQILKPSGSVVPQDAEIIEIETDKVNQVLYAPKGGQLSLTVKVGDKVKVGQVIGTVDTDVAVPTEQPKPAAAPSAPSAGPSARKMAGDFLAELKEPVTPKAAAPVKEGRRRMSALRRTIAQKLVEVKNQTAMLTTFNEVDMTAIMDIRAREKDRFQQKYGVKLGFMSFFVKASVDALREFPDVHSYIEGDEFVLFPNFDIGVAVSTDKGLMVPVVRKCETLSHSEIEKQLETLAKKAREGTIAVDDLRGGSFTITNGGVFGSLLSTPILNPPQSAILGMHAIVKRPVVVNDQIVIRPMMYLALSYDHRIIDGREAVLFLGRIKQALEAPSYADL